MNTIPETDSDNSDNQLTPAEITETAKVTVQDMLPQKSKPQYEAAYNKFIEWRVQKKIKSMSEDTLLTYFTELSKLQKPSTLWATYSMLKTTIYIKNNIKIQEYVSLITFLRKQSKGFQPKKSNILTPEQIKKFIDEAPDDKYLAIKLATIFGICGACRRDELTKIEIQDIQDRGSVLLVKIPTTKNCKPRTFVVTDEFYPIYIKYVTLRPNNIETSRFFLNYQNGKCTNKPIGINKFGKMPTIIAKYLKLPDPDSYTGHTFRRTSATLLADSGTNVLTLKQHDDKKSNTVDEGYIENSNNKKISNPITSTIVRNNFADLQTSETSFNDPLTSTNCVQDNEENQTISIQTDTNQSNLKELKEISISQVCLRWNSYHSNMQNSFPSLLDTEQFVDVTLACEGRSLKCHKIILSSCSDYLAHLLRENPCQHPIILMKDLKFWEIEALVKFMYRGEVDVARDKVPQLLNAAEALQVKGLAHLAGPLSQSTKPPLLIPQSKPSSSQLVPIVETKENKASPPKVTTSSSPKRGQKRQQSESIEPRPFTKIRLQRPVTPLPFATVKLEPLDTSLNPEMFSENNEEVTPPLDFQQLMSLHEEDDLGGEEINDGDERLHFCELPGPPDLNDKKDQIKFVRTDLLKQQQEILEESESGSCNRDSIKKDSIDYASADVEEDNVIS